MRFDHRYVLGVALVAVLLVFAGEAYAQSSSRTAWTTAPLRLREAPSTESEVITTLAEGVRITVFACADGWCRARNGGDEGFVASRYLTFSDPGVRSRSGGDGYRNSRGEWVPSPTHTRDGQPPAGASAQCRDGTYSFSRSRSGTCSGHGGVSRWLK